MTEAATPDSNAATQFQCFTILQAELGRIDLATAIPPKARRCSHWKTLGVISDQAKRLYLYRDIVSSELRTMQAENETADEAAAARANALRAPDDALFEELLAAHNAREQDFEDKKRWYDFLSSLLTQEIILEYPAAREEGAITLNERWELIWHDDSESIESFFDGLGSILAVVLGVASRQRH